MVAAMKLNYCHDKLFTRLIIELFYVKRNEKFLMKIEKFEKNCGRPGGGGVSKFGHPRTRGGGGVKKGQIFADVLYGWP